MGRCHTEGAVLIAATRYAIGGFHVADHHVRVEDLSGRRSVPDDRHRKRERVVARARVRAQILPQVGEGNGVHVAGGVELCPPPPQLASGQAAKEASMAASPRAAACKLRSFIECPLPAVRPCLAASKATPRGAASREARPIEKPESKHIPKVQALAPSVRRSGPPHLDRVVERHGRQRRGAAGHDVDGLPDW